MRHSFLLPKGVRTIKQMRAESEINFLPLFAGVCCGGRFARYGVSLNSCATRRNVRSVAPSSAARWRHCCPTSAPTTRRPRPSPSGSRRRRAAGSPLGTVETEGWYGHTGTVPPEAVDSQALEVAGSLGEPWLVGSHGGAVGIVVALGPRVSLRTRLVSQCSTKIFVLGVVFF